MKNRVFKPIALFFFFAFSVHIFAQSEHDFSDKRSATPTSSQSAPVKPGNRTKKVALVLAGGGAKGMAHIGVIKVIERAGIPIDIITGTSMGSIVGGLYSCGWNGYAMDTLVRKQNWKFLLSDRADYYSQDLLNRKRQNTYLLSKNFTSKQNNISETSGLIEGKNLMRLFNRLTAGYTDSMDFSQLPIPFACVATNIMDNTEYVFTSGVLANAMRTSMAIPAVFTPIRKDDMILVDGGLRNNFPADIAQKMGADYIIGSTVQGKPKTADDLANGASVIGQLVDVYCMNKYEDNLSITDIPIRVNTEGYSAASFSKAAIDTLIRRGEEEAMKHWDELMALKRKLGLPENFTPPPHEPNTAAQEAPAPTKEKNKERLPYDRIQGNLGVRFDSEEMVVLQLNGIYTPAYSPFDLEGTIRLGQDIKGEALAKWKPEHFTDVSLGYTFRHNTFDIYEKGDSKYNVTYNHHKAEFSLLNINIKNIAMDVSARWDYYNYNKVLVSSQMTNEGFKLKDDHYFSYHANFHYNSENDWIFPQRGAKFRAEYAYFTDNFTNYKDHAGFSEVSASWRMSFRLTKSLVLQPLLYGRLLFGSEIPLIRQNAIGGQWFGHYVEQQLPFVGIHHFEFTDPHFAACQIKLQEQLTTNNYILLRIAGAQHADKLHNLLDHSPILGCQAAYYYRSMFGPIGGSLSYSNRTKKPNFFINLGFEF